VPVTTAPVVRGDLLVRVLCDGRLEPPEGGEIRTADGGTVAAIAVHEGDRVGRGQLLLRLVNPDLEARVRDARSEVSMIKVFATEMAWDIIDKAMQTFGAMGMAKEIPLQLMASKVRLMRIYDGPSEVHRFALARAIMSGDPSLADSVGELK